MKGIKQLSLSGMALGALLGGTAIAEDGPEFDFKAAAGYQYDSNVSVSELDTNTGEADGALLAELGVQAKLPINDALSINLGYGYAQTSYRDLSDFDTALHSLQGELAYRVKGFDTGLAVRRFDARLDGEQFLDIRQVSPSVARLFGKTVYVRGALTRSDKHYADRDARDASNDALDVDAYLLLDGMRRYLAFGFRLEDEDANADELDFDGSRIRASYGQRFDRLELKAKLQTENRDYNNVNEDIGSPRHDRRFKAGIEAAFSINDYFSIESEAQYLDTSSNLPGANYDEVIYGISLAAEF